MLHYFNLQTRLTYTYLSLPYLNLPNLTLLPYLTKNLPSFALTLPAVATFLNQKIISFNNIFKVTKIWQIYFQDR